jgi:Asp-tRNA(Asn)/Glu-tRNA(Gln) amidotransferase A subunit family amidase
MKLLRFLFVVLAFTLGAALATQAKQFDLSTATIADINAAFDAGALSSEKLVGLYLKRIDAYDQKGPKLNVIIALNPKALDEARALDAERKAKGPRSPLHGVPVVIKDLIDYAGLPTTGGFKPFGAPIPERDATVVTKLKAAGAIVIAKVTTMNWFGKDGYGPSHPLGYPHNPYNLDYLPGDSSSGTGVSMAAYFAAVGIGTDTGGSVQNPTSYCSLAGMVATQGLVSRAGIVPRGPTHDRAGPMGRSVADITVLLSIISGWDAEDMGTMEGFEHFPQPEWIAQVAVPNLKGKRIGVLREMISPLPEDAEGRALFERALADLRKAGAQIVDPITTGIDLRIESSDNASQYERIPYGNDYLARLGPNRPFKTMQEFMAAAGDQMGSFYTLYVNDPPLDQHPDYLARLRKRKALRDLIDSQADRYALDGFVQLYNGRPGAIADGSGDSTRRSTGPARGSNLTSTTGLPAVIMPGGYTEKGNLPVGIQFVGKSFTDLKVLQLAYGYEQASHRRKTPESTPPLPGEKFDY